MADNWPLWLCLFLSSTIFTVGWTVWKRRHRVVSERLTWAATAIGVALILGWLAVIRPELAPFLALGFGLGGAPAVILGVIAVIEFMLESARHE